MSDTAKSADRELPECRNCGGTGYETKGRQITGPCLICHDTRAEALLRGGEVK